MAEKTKVITVGENQINVADLPKETRLMIEFMDKLAEEFEALEQRVQDVNEQFSFELSTLNMARNQAQLQLQNMVMEFLQKQVTAAPEEDGGKHEVEVTEDKETENAE